MDKDVIVVINVEGQEPIEYRFKLKSQVVVELEKIFGKNIFDIFANMSFTNVQTVLHKCVVQPEVCDKHEMMDDLLCKYSLLELGGTLIKDIAAKSGLVKTKETDDEAIDPNA